MSGAISEKRGQLLRNSPAISHKSKKDIDPMRATVRGGSQLVNGTKNFEIVGGT
jgi:hypothetical protein